MNVLKRFIGKLLYPRTFKFTNNLKDSFIEAVKQTSQFDASVRDLSQTWLAVCPHTYFSELFLESENWNVPFVRAFERSDMVDAQGCYQLTQAFYLRHLFRIISQDAKYRKYSQETITQNILSHLNVGTEILALASDFERAIKDMTSIQDFSMFYVEKILQTQYPDKNVLDSILNSIWMESDSLFGLNVFTSESIKRAKYIDAQVSSDS
jgi:hypothetical protein